MSMGDGGSSSSQSAPASTTVVQPNTGGVQALYGMANQQLAQASQQTSNNPFTNQLLQMATNWQPPQQVPQFNSPSATATAASVTANTFNRNQQAQQFFNFR